MWQSTKTSATFYTWVTLIFSTVILLQQRCSFLLGFLSCLFIQVPCCHQALGSGAVRQSTALCLTHCVHWLYLGVVFAVSRVGFIALEMLISLVIHSTKVTHQTPNRTDSKTNLQKFNSLEVFLKQLTQPKKVYSVCHIIKSVYNLSSILVLCMFSLKTSCYQTKRYQSPKSR